MDYSNGPSFNSQPADIPGSPTEPWWLRVLMAPIQDQDTA